MSAMADATALAIERACDKVGGIDREEREAFAERFYRGDASYFERAAVQAELAKITRADIGRPVFSDTREKVLDVEGPIAADGFDSDPFEQI